MTLLHIDNLSLIMMLLVGFIGLCVASFSIKYLRGDAKQGRFYFNLQLLIAFVFIMVSADNVVLFLVSWMMSNVVLTKLMLHKPQWIAAKNSARLARNNFMLGNFFLASALAIMWYVSGETSIQKVIQSSPSPWLLLSSFLLIIAAMTQSALLPFHRWLTSSLNSPTPVSAIMHAGLVNGGGFLLARFAPLFIQQPSLLNTLFVVGSITAIVGTVWKLMQSDIKRMLACSTIGQMGFMIAQCGLGLFPAAITHLCWHGMFKANLFLSSGNAAQEKPIKITPPGILDLLIALACGAVASFVFCISSGRPIVTHNTNLFLSLLTWIAATQFALTVISKRSLKRIITALLLTMFMGLIYGVNVWIIESLLKPINISFPITMNLLHISIFMVLLIGWLSILFGPVIAGKGQHSQWLYKLYVQMLNASQPAPSTVSTYKKQYQY